MRVTICAAFSVILFLAFVGCSQNRSASTFTKNDRLAYRVEKKLRTGKFTYYIQPMKPLDKIFTNQSLNEGAKAEIILRGTDLNVWIERPGLAIDNGGYESVPAEGYVVIHPNYIDIRLIQQLPGHQSGPSELKINGLYDLR